MSEADVRRQILARRARFVAAAVAGMTMAGCPRRDSAPTDDATPAIEPQACLKVAAPQACVKNPAGSPAPEVSASESPSSALSTSPGDVSIGAPEGASGLPDVASFLARQRWRFKVCLTRALATDPKAAGTVKVKVQVGAGGEVTSATLASSDAPADLSQCIVTSFKAMTFAAPTGGAATFTVPIVLSLKK